ncbi:MAG TPA: peptidylprolyl isomerase [Burkholderiales bacterium]|jgi:FKBP-type peptidyl-prolyl cis-trans isomerase SlyD|nr:peptidylprolyl isomerase [Burkholderiales bacterium]
MKVTKDTVVRLSVEMDGDSGGRELEYLHGGYGSLFPKLEAALAGLEAGGKANVTLSPADGFGEHDPSLIRREPRERLPQGVKVGSALHGGHAEEDGHRRVFRVTALSDTEATLDGNHPLAGRTVELRCEVLEVRAATQEEIEHGHVHGPHGHSH